MKYRRGIRVECCLHSIYLDGEHTGTSRSDLGNEFWEPSSTIINNYDYAKDIKVFGVTDLFGRRARDDGCRVARPTIRSWNGRWGMDKGKDCVKFTLARGRLLSGRKGEHTVAIV